MSSLSVILSEAKNLFRTNAQFSPLRPILPEILHCAALRKRMTGRGQRATDKEHKSDIFVYSFCIFWVVAAIVVSLRSKTKGCCPAIRTAEIIPIVPDTGNAETGSASIIA